MEISIEEFLVDVYTGKLNTASVDKYLELATKQKKLYTQKNYFEKAFMWSELKKLCETIKEKNLPNGLHR